MQRALRETTYNFHSPLNPPQFTVAPGEVFLAETELCTGGWLLSYADSWTPDKTCALNPTVVVAVDGAAPGDVLAVTIHEVTPAEVGYTGFNKDSNSLANHIIVNDWGLNVKTVKIENGFVLWDEKRKLPIAPMIGTLGTAPAVEALSNAKAGVHGGNMDVQEVCAGSTVYLPVEVSGALLHIGDCHAIQGDGEINCSGGIECRAVCKLSVELIKKPAAFGGVRIENDDYIMTVASEGSTKEAFLEATKQLVLWMVADYGFTVNEAYLLLGQVMEARATQYVNPTQSYICKMPKKYL